MRISTVTDYAALNFNVSEGLSSEYCNSLKNAFSECMEYLIDNFKYTKWLTCYFFQLWVEFLIDSSLAEYEKIML